MSDFNSSLPIRTQNNADVIATLCDGTLTTQLLGIDSSGRITVNQGTTPWVTNISQIGGSSLALGQTTMSSSLPVTIASNQSALAVSQSGTWTVATNADGSPSGGTAGSKSLLSGGIYNSSLPTLTTGQQASLQLDSSGRLLVDIGAASTITVNQGTSPWITSDSADGAVANGTAGSKSMLGGLIYLAAAPTITTGNQNSLLGDINGNLLVNLKTALPAGANTIGNVNIQSSGTTLTNTAGALNVNISSGSLDVGVADKTAFTYGTSVFQPIGGVFQDTSPTLTAGTSGAARLTTNRAIHVNLRDASGNEKLGSSTSANSIPVVIASDQGAISVNASQTGTWTVQPGNTANTTPWLVTDGSDGSVAAGTAAGKSSLAGLVFNTAAPSLTNGQQVAMQGDSSGNLLVNLKTALPAGANTIGAVTQASGPWTSNITQIGGSSLALGQTTMSASIPVTFASNQSALPVSGTVAVTQSTSPWVENVSQFGGNAVVTGTGTSGAGIPRVTVSSDSAVLANIQVAGSAVSNTNPVPVTISASVSGTPIESYQTSAALAVGATANLQYTVTAAKTLSFCRCWSTASGKIKVVVSVETGVATGVFTTKFVGFNSTANPNIDITVFSPIQVAAGVRVQAAITNKDTAAMDVYATFEGSES